MKFSAHSNAANRREGATTLAKLLLTKNSPALSEHVGDLIDILLWRITEADGKYNTVYQTTGAIACKEKSHLRHEHVYQRSKMIGALINAKPEEWDGILKDAIGCVVTIDEHERLKQFDDEYGWTRYRKAGIIVVDTSTHPPKPLD